MRERPVFLKLWKIHLPLAAFISITHRISGVVFFLGVPVLLYLYALLPLSNEISELVTLTSVKLILWVLVNLYIYHFLAGMRHMVADFGHNHSLKRANSSAVVVIVLAVILAIWSGVLLW
ncbi:MAG: succinate dehydrogenase, cytochrome b556 subunit [Pseudomonadota bacterium]|nr:succinate dehydrogenase, cytochrome b556 subunit [Pseudomonadota bacterium]